ncbi:MAG: hypothetical protein EBX52_11715, partial [Proteobacteria bacterium]|nr:hypothetical protein [Pseudomonadota bacterium]
MSENQDVSTQRSTGFYKLCTGASVFFSLSAGFLAGYHLEISQIQSWHSTITRHALEQVSERNGFKPGRPDFELKLDRTIPSIAPLDTHVLVVANGLSTQVPVTRVAPAEPAASENIEITLSSALSEKEQKALTTLLLQSKGGATFAESPRGKPGPAPASQAVRAPSPQEASAQRNLLAKRRAAALLARLDPSLVSAVDPDSVGFVADADP